MLQSTYWLFVDWVVITQYHAMCSDITCFVLSILTTMVAAHLLVVSFFWDINDSDLNHYYNVNCCSSLMVCSWVCEKSLVLTTLVMTSYVAAHLLVISVGHHLV